MTILTSEVRQRILAITRDRGGLSYGSYGVPGGCRCLGGAVMEATHNDVEPQPHHVNYRSTAAGKAAMRQAAEELGFGFVNDLFRFSDRLAIKPLNEQLAGLAAKLGVAI